MLYFDNIYLFVGTRQSSLIANNSEIEFSSLKSVDSLEAATGFSKFLFSVATAKITFVISSEEEP